MNKTFTIKEKLKQIFILLIPILITQLGMFAMVFFNTVLSGNYHSSALAGVAIGTSIWNPVFIGLSGILLAVSPIAAQYCGEKRNTDVSFVMTHGVYLGLAIAVLVIAAGVFFLEPLLDAMKLDAAVRKVAHGYLTGMGLGVIPLFLFTALRSFIYALGNTRIVMIILLLALPVNLFFNYVLIFGKGMFPELGGAGGGYATAVTYWFILALTIYVLKSKRPFAHYVKWKYFKVFSWKRCVEILKIGIPMGFSMFFETSMFAAVTILISRFTVETVAAYQSALNIISLLYMIPLSLSMALTVIVGFEVGARRFRDAKIYSWLGILMSIGIALIAGLSVVVFRSEVASLYSNETEVLVLIARFLIYALFFHISDSLQVTAQAALRGYKDVNFSLVTTLIAYWLVCLPCGYLMAHPLGLGPIGYWLGLTIGLLAAGLALSCRLVYIQKRKFSN